MKSGISLLAIFLAGLLALAGCGSGTTAPERPAPSAAPAATAPDNGDATAADNLNEVPPEQFCIKGPRARLDTSNTAGNDPKFISGTACIVDDVQEMWMLILHGDKVYKTGGEGSPVAVASDHRFSVISPDTSRFPGPQSGSIIFYVVDKANGQRLAQLPDEFDRSQLPPGGQVAGIKFF